MRPTRGRIQTSARLLFPGWSRWQTEAESNDAGEQGEPPLRHPFIRRTLSGDRFTRRTTTMHRVDEPRTARSSSRLCINAAGLYVVHVGDPCLNRSFTVLVFTPLVVCFFESIFLSSSLPPSTKGVGKILSASGFWMNMKLQFLWGR